jgi:hypothetical protein
MEKEFYAVESLLRDLRRDAILPTRFPVRFILAKGLSLWKELIEALKIEAGLIMYLSELCNENDIFPDLNFSEFKKRIQNNLSKHVLILPLSESLRLYPSQSYMLRELAQWEMISDNRVYIPLLELSELFYNEMKLINRYQSNELPDTYILNGDGNICLQVSSFKLNFYAEQTTTINGIEQYLKTWEQGGNCHIYLISQFANYFNERSEQKGAFEIKILKNGYDAILSQIENPLLTIDKSWGNDKQWNWLAERLKTNEALIDGIKRMLNVHTFDVNALLSLWHKVDDNFKWLIWLYGKLQSRGTTYFEQALQKSKDYRHLVEDLLNFVFTMKLSEEHLKERKRLLGFCYFNELPDSFWRQFEILKNPFDKLNTLAGLTDRERRETILIVKKLLESKSRHDTWLHKLYIAFPELAYYLNGFLFSDDFITRYFRLYNLSRLIDLPLEELLTLAYQAGEDKILWRFDSREKVIESIKKTETPIFWVDGMGLEWMGLFSELLKQSAPHIQWEIKIGRVNLPSITECNKGWSGNEDVIRDIDKIAHEYDYQFPTSFLKQMEVIKVVVAKAINIFERYGGAIITSDHGLTRFASRSATVMVPEGTEVINPGRYAILSGDYEANDFNRLCVCEVNKLFLLTHDKFSGGSSTVGEAHGGATLEECLVPVIKLTQRQKQLKATVMITSIDSVVKLNVQGVGIFNITLSEIVKELRLHVKLLFFEGVQKSDNRWEFILTGLDAGHYQGRLECEHGFIKAIQFKLVKGIIQDDLGL